MQHSLNQGSSVSENNVKAMFEKYKDADTKNIEAGGVMKFFENIGITDVENDRATLLVSFHMKAKSMGVVTLEEMKTGCKSVGADTE